MAMQEATRGKPLRSAETEGTLHAVAKTEPLAMYTKPEEVPSIEHDRVGRWAGLRIDSEFDDVALANAIAQGLPLSSLVAFTGLFGKSVELLPEAALRRLKRARARLPKQHSQTVYQMYLVLDVVAQFYQGDADRIRAFMLGPHELLGGQTPFDMARSSSAGARTVRKLLEQTEAGVAL